MGWQHKGRMPILYLWFGIFAALPRQTCAFNEPIDKLLEELTDMAAGNEDLAKKLVTEVDGPKVMDLIEDMRRNMEAQEHKLEKLNRLMNGYAKVLPPNLQTTIAESSRTMTTKFNFLKYSVAKKKGEALADLVKTHHQQDNGKETESIPGKIEEGESKEGQPDSPPDPNEERRVQDLLRRENYEADVLTTSDPLAEVSHHDMIAAFEAKIGQHAEDILKKLGPKGEEILKKQLGRLGPEQALEDTGGTFKEQVENRIKRDFKSLTQEFNSQLEAIPSMLAEVGKGNRVDDPEEKDGHLYLSIPLPTDIREKISNGRKDFTPEDYEKVSEQLTEVFIDKVESLMDKTKSDVVKLKKRVRLGEITVADFQDFVDILNFMNAKLNSSQNPQLNTLAHHRSRKSLSSPMKLLIDHSLTVNEKLSESEPLQLVNWSSKPRSQQVADWWDIGKFANERLDLSNPSLDRELLQFRLRSFLALLHHELQACTSSEEVNECAALSDEEIEFIDTVLTSLRHIAGKAYFS